MTMEGIRVPEQWLDKLPDLRVVAVSLLVLTVVTVTLFTLKKSRLRDQKEVPEPPAWPLIGHLHVLGKLPHQNLMQLARRCGPIMSIRLGGLRVIVASNAEMAKEFLKTQDAVWASRPLSIFTEVVVNYSDQVFQPLNDTWRKTRKILVSELMSTTHVEKQKDQRHESIMRMLNSILAPQQRNKLVDIYAAVSNMNFYQFSKLIFGKNFSPEYTARTATGKTRTLPQVVRSLASTDILSVGDCFPRLRPLDLGGNERKLLRIRGEFDAYFTEIIEERRRQLLEGKDDGESHDFLRGLLSLLDKDDGSGLTYDNIRAILLDLFAAGIETTAALVTWTVAEIMRHPDIKEKLVKELDDVIGQERLVEESDLVKLKYLKMVVKETFRLHPPLPLLLFHCSTAPSVVAGYNIPAGTTLFVNVYAVQRDPELWEDPLAFKPERFSDSSIDVSGQHFELLPFGSGRRLCPGMGMGLITAELVLARLFHMLNIALRPGMKPEDVDMTEKTGLATALVTPLEVVASPRLPENLFSM